MSISPLFSSYPTFEMTFWRVCDNKVDFVVVPIGKLRAIHYFIFNKRGFHQELYSKDFVL